MKKIILMTAACICLQTIRAQVNDPNQVAKDAATNHANNDMDNAANKGVDKAEQSIGNLFKKKNKDKKQETTNTNNQATGKNANQTNTQDTNSAPAASIKTYQNYDFVPGDKILFEDNFADEQDGEFPSHWKLQSGQAVINKLNNEQAFFLTEGNYVKVSPRMKNMENYLPENFTIEFDFYATEGSYTPGILFKTSETGDRYIFFGKEVSTSYFPNNLSATYPGDQDNFVGKWHHAAVIKTGNQIKCYEDQFRVLVMPDCEDCKVTTLDMGGIGSINDPIILKNFRLAEGGNMNMIGKKFTDAKIITHGINFDIDKATIRPESMGTLNMIVQILKDNPDVKFEIDGHTDNSGTASHNLTLSQQRSDAVKLQLLNMGVDAARLSSKGFGDTKPIADNNTPEGKANNRRVEFVRQ
ncbi:MAG: OmpA family protein [Bacteroidetes bacterium]|nr:OmpA family protein [Bacteroidota bacterium]